jgi:y4mF family transcriptional regulator
MVNRLRRTEEIGSLIRARRLELGIDQQTLADRLGVSRPWVSEIENGKPRVQLQLVLRCLNELQIALWAGTSYNLADQNPSMSSGMDGKAISSTPKIDIDSIADMGLEKRPKRGKP